MRKDLLVFALIGVLLLLAVPLVAQDEGPPRTGMRPDAPPYAIRGPHPVGFMTFSDGNTERPMEGGIWYPALNPDGLPEEIVYDVGIGDLIPPINAWAGRALLDAAPDTANGPYPLILSSHGHGGTYHHTIYVHENLASHGFVVMAMWHPGDTFRDSLLAQNPEQQAALAEAFIGSLVLRPQDIRQTLDYAELLAEDMLVGLIDLEHVGAMGMSYGGYTALAVAGARLDFSGLADLCAAGTQASILTSVICQIHGADLAEMEMRLMELAGVEGDAGQLWPSLSDARIDAAVALVPGGGTVLMTEASYADVQVPLLLTRSSNDPFAVPAHNVDPAWEFAASANKSLVNFAGAGHSVSVRCSPFMMSNPDPNWFSFCNDAVWDPDRAHDLTNHFVTAFLLDVLKGDAEAHAALLPDAVSFPGIDYETTMR